MNEFNPLPSIVCALTLAFSTAQAQTIVIDDFSTSFANTPNTALMVDGVASSFDELYDIAPAGSIGDRHEWLSGFNFQYAGIPNNLYITDINGSVFPGTMIFGGFDYNLEFGLDYTPTAGAPAFDLTAGGGNAFSIDVVFSDIPSAPMTITVVTGTGTASLSVDALLDDSDITPTTYIFDFGSFSGTPDFADVQSISWSLLTVDEFGPDAMLDNFEVVSAAPISFTVPSLTAGAPMSMLISGATPNQPVYFVYSTVGLASTYISALNVSLDLAVPTLIGSSVANSSGDTSLTRTIPSGALGLSVFFQAIQNQRKSNPELRVVM